jgi:hypothetical protein
MAAPCGAGSPTGCRGHDADAAMAPAATSLAAGAIARSVDDAHAAYRARLARAVADLRDASTRST